MGGREFAEWQVMFRNDQLHPAIDQARHAQVLAAIYTGQAKPAPGEKGHRAASFMAKDPWAEPVNRKQPTAAQLKAQIESMNARFRHGK
jgi:hypothetical protein